MKKTRTNKSCITTFANATYTATMLVSSLGLIAHLYGRATHQQAQDGQNAMLAMHLMALAFSASNLFANYNSSYNSSRFFTMSGDARPSASETPEQGARDYPSRALSQ